MSHRSYIAHLQRTFVAILFFSALASAQVKLGIDILRDDHFQLLTAKRVGLVAHPSSVDSSMTPTVELLATAPNVKLVALFGPEHGIYGDLYAGEQVKERNDPRTGLPVYSVYGKTRHPTTQMLKSIDALVFDLQEIGSRSYTFISSMKACMQECAKHDIDFIVLDRPNPLGGERVEGPMLSKPFESFIGYLYVPYVYGMTMGELAQYVQATELPKYKKLHVVKMTGWKRDMLWEDTGLRWVPSSPHIPHPRTCAYYAATGFLGELAQLSNGCGYTLPFEIAAVPWIKADNLADALNDHWNAPALHYRPLAAGGKPMNIPPLHPQAITFRPLYFKPFYASFKEELCQGVQVYADPRPRATPSLVEINFRIMEAVGAPDLFAKATKKQIRSFDITCGSDEPRKYLTDLRNLQPLFDKWKAQCEQFRKARRTYLLYD